MATFSLVSQALRTSEPLPQAFNQNLLDRLLYHGQVLRNASGTAALAHDDAHRAHLDFVFKYEYIFYASAVSAVFQLLEVGTYQRTTRCEVSEYCVFLLLGSK